MHLEKCCCCFELKTGALFIGYLTLMTDVALSYATIMGLIASRVAMVEGSTDAIRSIGSVLFMVLFFDLALIFINLFFAAMLLIGIHQKKRGYVRTYLIASTIFVLITMIILPSSIATGATIRNIILDVISIVFNIYSLLVIRSYVKQEYDDNESIASEMA